MVTGCVSLLLMPYPHTLRIHASDVYFKHLLLIAGRSKELADNAMCERTQLGIFSGLFSTYMRLSHCVDPACERVEYSSGYPALDLNLLRVQHTSSLNSLIEPCRSLTTLHFIDSMSVDQDGNPIVFTIRVFVCKADVAAGGNFAKRSDSELFCSSQIRLSALRLGGTGKGRQIYVGKHSNSVGNSSGDTGAEL